MKKEMTDNKSLSKLELLRQNKGLKKQTVDVEKAITGFASSIDDKAMMEEISRNSSDVNFIVDNSGSMEGTSYALSREINEFAVRQEVKPYKTLVSLTLFDNSICQMFSKLNVRNFVPIGPWDCNGGTNIYDALFSAISTINNTDIKHKLYLIITDGENGRSEHSRGEVQRLVTERIENGDHIFLLYNDEHSSNSAERYASELGINPSNAVNFNRKGDGIKIIFQTIEDLLDGLRANGAVSEDWARAIKAHAANPLGVKAREIKYLE